MFQECAHARLKFILDGKMQSRLISIIAAVYHICATKSLEQKTKHCLVSGSMSIGVSNCPVHGRTAPSVKLTNTGAVCEERHHNYLVTPGRCMH